MSFSKAQDLIRLARLAASRRSGISLDEICQEFGISHRTAQRMTDALETTFMNVEAVDFHPELSRFFHREVSHL
jgi:predicted DNA-binding transcriptional regulator YafY